MRRSIVVASVVLLGAPFAASAASNAPAPLDQHYLMTSIEGDHFEIQGGKMALEKAGCPAATRLAKRLVADHSKSLVESTKLARRLGVEVPKQPTPSMQWELGQIASQTGSTFDKAYATLERSDHVEDIQNTTEEISKGQTPEVQAAARKELPMLRKHLTLSKAAVKAC